MNETLYEKIEAYLLGELDTETNQAFEAALKTNKELADQVEMQRFEHVVMELLLEKDLRQEMVEWGKEDAAPNVAVQSNNQKSEFSVVKGGAKNRRWFYALAAAASLALIAVVGWWLNKKPISPNEPSTESKGEFSQKIDTPSVKTQTIPSNVTSTKTKESVREKGEKQKLDNRMPTNNENEIAVLSPDEGTKYAKIAEKNYNADAPSFETREIKNTESETILNKAIKAYNQKSYENTVDLLKNLPPTDDNFEGIKVLAHAYFQLKQYGNAATSFETVLNMSGKGYRATAQWYLLLSYLGDYKHQATKFKALSAEIISADKEYSKNVEALLADMKTK